MSQHVYTITPQAYTKMVLHAAAYPTASVNGVLLATSSSVAKGENIEVVDAVPLLHARLVLSPMLEVALEQLDYYCNNTGHTIIGYYQANAMLTARSLGPAGERVASQIQNNTPAAFAVVIDNQKLSAQPPEPALIYYTYQDGQWRGNKELFRVDNNTPKLAVSAIQAKLFRDLVDFDTHLSTPSADWIRNPVVSKALAQS